MPVDHCNYEVWQKLFLNDFKDHRFRDDQCIDNRATAIFLLASLNSFSHFTLQKLCRNSLDKHKIIA